jgi:glycogen phosphorylase
MEIKKAYSDHLEPHIAQDGTMKVVYDPIVPPNKKVRDFLPLEAVKKAGTNEDLIVSVPMKGRTVKARVWKARMGRNDLLLLDSNLRENRVHDRHITRRLYASQKIYEQERQRRLEQELLLGIGGVQAVIGGGYAPQAYHLNEGHVAFAAIEVIRNLMQKDSLSFDAARERCSQILGFTTHTPVPEGNERFDERLVRDYLEPFLDSFLTPQERDTLFNCARNREDSFDMTKLSLLLSGVYRNGVSALHGEECRKMWGYAWGNHDPEGRNVPIDSITNAVHVPYWQKPLLRKLIDEYGGAKNADQIPDQKIWDLHLEFKNKLIQKVRELNVYQMLRLNIDSQTVHEKTHRLLSVDSFMIGFARRFADYKRVTMILDDEERLFTFLENAYKKYKKPIHILYAGKPHPNNYSGRDRIRFIIEQSQRLEKRAAERGFEAQLVFIQGYDIDLARYLEAGVDIWLNNPIRPLEASGTSGMKAGMNGVLNVSISDGWVPEGVVHGKNGWLFGKGEAAATDSDRNELFRLLEENILPLYFQNSGSEKFSQGWIAMMKESIRSITTQFNTDRMLSEYIEKMYLPAVRAAKEHELVREAAARKS